MHLQRRPPAVSPATSRDVRHPVARSPPVRSTQNPCDRLPRSRPDPPRPRPDPARPPIDPRLPRDHHLPVPRRARRPRGDRGRGCLHLAGHGPRHAETGDPRELSAPRRDDRATTGPARSSSPGSATSSARSSPSTRSHRSCSMRRPRSRTRRSGRTPASTRRHRRRGPGLAARLRAAAPRRSPSSWSAPACSPRTWSRTRTGRSSASSRRSSSRSG